MNATHVVHPSPSGSTQTVQITDEDKLEITPLGAGNEVGRSAILCTFKGRSVLFDCGIHPANTGIASLPFFDEIRGEPASIDLVLISHFHLDHCGAVPYFLEKTNFKGRIFMTHPTKAIYKLLLSDFVKVSDTSIDESLFNEQDLNKSIEKIELIDYHQEMEHNGIKFWCYNAGHVLGAAMFMIEIAGVKVLYTGDFSRQADRHLLGAETPTLSPDVLIVESTYGIQVHESRRTREVRFTTMVHEIVKRGGRCLIPVFALGRAQELLLILDEYWETHPELQKIPIYYASSLAKKCMAVFQTYINMMNDRIRKQFDLSNPFIFKHISNLKSIEDFDDSLGPCVIMASPGMLQSGLSRELFEMWCSNERNGVIIPGYSVEGTMAKKITTEPQNITLSNGITRKLLMSVKSISFSAHSDREQTEEFIGSIKPPHVILVHGDPTNCARLKQALTIKFQPDTTVYTPKNCEAIEIVFKGTKTATVLGSLAANSKVKTLRHGEHVQGILLHKDFNHMLVSPDDLKFYSDISCAGVLQKMMVPLPRDHECDTADQLADYWINKLSNRFQDVLRIGSLDEDDEDQMAVVKSEGYDSDEDGMQLDKNKPLIYDQDKVDLLVCGRVKVGIKVRESNEATLEWPSNVTNDTIVDALCYAILENDFNVNYKLDKGAVEDTRHEMNMLYLIQQLLKEQYDSVDVDLNSGCIHMRVNGFPVVVTSKAQVHCDDVGTRSVLEIVMRRVYLALFPIPSMMGCLDEHDHEMHDHE
ncbi:cleavage and polyadenylation specificity factor subunit CPSF3 [Acrasis kona]|uniref:Cleavage and polyadenylation specificity factor subunit CPSF3 n=1 Tax=Acrasis kona TaxID=1008807 RepID=A0AAW2Z297_9EUKA